MLIRCDLSTLKRRRHTFIALLPVRRTNVSARLGELVRLQGSKNFVDVSSDGKVVDCRALDNTFFINDEYAAVRNATVSKHIVIVAMVLLMSESSG